MSDPRLSEAHCAVFKKSESLQEYLSKIKGYDFNRGVDYSQLLKHMISTGFQAANLGDAIVVVNDMLDWRLADEVITEDCSQEEKDPIYRKSVRCKVFLGFTSNLISSGVRGVVGIAKDYFLLAWSMNLALCQDFPIS